MNSLACRKFPPDLKSFLASGLPLAVLFCFFFFSLIIWISLDRTVPVWDSAAHLLHSYNMRDALVAHICLKKKIHALFTCSSWYPPLFNWVHCLFLMSPIPCTVGDQLPRLVFFAIGMFSLYKLGCQLFDDVATGLVAAAIFFALPGVCVIAHTRGLIDLPLASMIFFALWRIACWNSKPSLANSLAAGCALGLACLTKQMGAIFLIPAIFLVVLHRLAARDIGKTIQFSYGVGLAAILYLSWLLPNLATVTRNLNLDEQLLASQGSGFPLWSKNFDLYCQHIVLNISVPAAALFFLSLFNFPAQRKLWLPASTIIGFLILCTLRWDSQDVRYVLPVLGYVALSISALLVRLWQNGSPLLRGLDVIFGLYLLTIYFVFNFTPFPCCFPASLLDRKFNGLIIKWPGVFPGEPYPLEPIAYNWLLGRVQSEHLDHQGVIMVAAVSPNCEITSIAYLARQRGIPLAFRSLTNSNASVYRCNPSDVEADPDWYVTLKDDQSLYETHFLSGQEFDNYNKLKMYFETSGNFEKAGECLFPDGKTCLVLYRRREPLATG